LNESLEALSPDASDGHINNLAQLVVAMKPYARDAAFEIPLLLCGVNSTEEQEEVEKDA
jgi:hypothetical protein